MKNEIILYQSDELPEHIEVRLDEDTVWLSLNQIAQLFNRDKSVISRHLRNIYKEGELTQEATVAKNATVQIEAGRKVNREIEYYNFESLSKEVNKISLQLKTKELSPSHDRFLIIDQKELYHIGASLKDLGKKPVVSEVEPWFAFSKMDNSITALILEQLNREVAV